MKYFDQLFRRFILTQSFVRGWGNPSHLKEIYRFRREKIGVRSECLQLVSQDHRIDIVRQETKGDRLLIHGKFASPLAQHLPHLVREDCSISIRRQR